MPFLATLGALARTVARARVRAGQADPLGRVRAFAKKHAALTFAAPAVAWLAYAAEHYVRHNPNPADLREHLVSFAVGAPAVFLLHLLMTRFALPALLAPTIDEREKAETNEATSELEFAAVALTRETRLAVDGLAVLTAALVGVLIAMPTLDSIAIDVSVALYVPTAIFAAVTFRRASRIAVGSDGIHVHGSSRSRFYAWNDLDGVRTKGIDIELFRGERSVLRLQLHGRDAARRDALVERINVTIARAHEERDQPVTSFVNGATPDDLAHAAEGGGSYRRVAVSRDQLWAALEGPTVASAARLAAAEALARSTDPSERTRFRVAADHCAEPSLRLRMRELLDEEEDDAPAPAKRATLAS